MKNKQKEWVRKGYNYILPKGEYLIGDPCYVDYKIEKEKDTWMEFLNAWYSSASGLKDFNGYWKYIRENEIVVEKYFMSQSFKFRGLTAFATSTKDGDGTYSDNEGNEYGVDSGSLGCVPIEVADPEQVKKAKKGNEFGLVYRKFDDDFYCKMMDGKFHIDEFGPNSCIIDTDPRPYYDCCECDWDDCECENW